MELLRDKVKIRTKTKIKIHLQKKDKSVGAIPKARNYCHIKLKAFPKMFSLKFCFAKFGAS